MADKKIGEHRFKLGGNGGEEISLTTTYFANGDPGGFYTNQKLSMQSYCNSASFELCGDTLDPATLRKLADELENQERKLFRKTKIDSKDILLSFVLSFEPGERYENEAFAEIVSGYLNLGHSPNALVMMLDGDFIFTDLEYWASGAIVPCKEVQSLVVEGVKELLVKG